MIQTKKQASSSRSIEKNIENPLKKANLISFIRMKFMFIHNF